MAVMGPLGCGKSTLLDVLELPGSPTNGDYFLDGDEVGEFYERQCPRLSRGTIGFILQRYNLIEEATVYENVELALLYVYIP